MGLASDLMEFAGSHLGGIFISLIIIIAGLTPFFHASTGQTVPRCEALPSYSIPCILPVQA